MSEEEQKDQGRIQQALKQAPWRTQTQATSLVLAVVVLLLVIGALYLAQASRTTAAGRRLQALEDERQSLEQQNAQLRAEIAALRSVQRLTAQAEALGYHEARSNEVEYLVITDMPPRVAVPEPLPVEDEMVARYDETLEGWLFDRLASFRERLQELGGNPGEEPEADSADDLTVPGETPEEDDPGA